MWKSYIGSRFLLSVALLLLILLIIIVFFPTKKRSTLWMTLPLGTSGLPRNSCLLLKMARGNPTRFFFLSCQLGYLSPFLVISLNFWADRMYRGTMPSTKATSFCSGKRLLLSIESTTIMPPGANISYRYTIFTSLEGVLRFSKYYLEWLKWRRGGAPFGNERLTAMSDVFV